MLPPERAQLLLEKSKPSRCRVPRYQRATVFDLWKGVCVYCARPLNRERKAAWGVTHLIPTHLGGPQDIFNRAPACRSCLERYARVDVLHVLQSGALALADHTHTQRIIDRRANALFLSANHLTHVSPRSGIKPVRNKLAQRFQNERTRLLVSQDSTHCHIALAQHSGSPSRVGEIAALLRVGFGAHLVFGDSSSEMVVFEMSADDFNSAAWELIEENALLIVAGDRPHQAVSDHWVQFWDWTFNTVRENSARCRRSQTPAPRRILVAPRSHKSSARAERKRYANKRATATLRTVNQLHLADLRMLSGALTDHRQREHQVESALLQLIKHNKKGTD